MRSLVILGCLGVFAGPVAAQPANKTDFATERTRPAYDVTVTPVTDLSHTGPSYTPKMLLKMRECDLAELYRRSPPAPVPCGFAPGLMINKPGSMFTSVLARGVQCSAWQGKYFPGDGMMYNVTFGVPTVRTTIYPGESWFDGGPSLIFDYEETSLLFPRCRDEVREVCPGVYLGILHKRTKKGPKLWTWFVLDTRPRDCGEQLKK